MDRCGNSGLKSAVVGAQKLTKFGSWAKRKKLQNDAKTDALFHYLVTNLGVKLYKIYQRGFQDIQKCWWGRSWDGTVFNLIVQFSQLFEQTFGPSAVWISIKKTPNQAFQIMRIPSDGVTLLSNALISWFRKDFEFECKLIVEKIKIIFYIYLIIRKKIP